MNMVHLAISYDNKLFIPVDVPANGNCLLSALVKSNIIPISDSKTFRPDLSNRTKTLLKNGSSHGRLIRNYFNINEKSCIGGSIEDYIDCVLSMNIKWGSTFVMICVSIIYCVRIISIANISGGFMVSDTLSLLNTYQIVDENSVMSDKFIYMYCHMYNTPTTPCHQDIIRHRFAYLDVVEELPTDSMHQIYYDDRRDNVRSGKIDHPISIPSSSGHSFSLMVTYLSAPSISDNSFCHIFSPYSKIVNLSQRLCNFESSKVKDNSGQKKRKLIINSNISLKK